MCRATLSDLLTTRRCISMNGRKCFNGGAINWTALKRQGLKSQILTYPICFPETNRDALERMGPRLIVRPFSFNVKFGFRFPENIRACKMQE